MFKTNGQGILIGETSLKGNLKNPIHPLRWTARTSLKANDGNILQANGRGRTACPSQARVAREQAATWQQGFARSEKSDCSVFTLVLSTFHGQKMMDAIHRPHCSYASSSRQPQPKGGPNRHLIDWDPNNDSYKKAIEMSQKAPEYWDEIQSHISAQ
eukprot:207163-Chlamydomonas_euryale.AAC.2